MYIRDSTVSMLNMVVKDNHLVEMMFEIQNIIRGRLAELSNEGDLVVGKQSQSQVKSTRGEIKVKSQTKSLKTTSKQVTPAEYTFLSVIPIDKREVERRVLAQSQNLTSKKFLRIRSISI